MATCLDCGVALPGGARFCLSCGRAVEIAKPSVERKVATILFADLVGSTAFAGSEDPERTRAHLNRFYDAMSAEIGETGGTVEKFAGDAVMAVFGAPAAQEDHAERALTAACSMRERLEDLFGIRFRLRIGVNTGEVVVGLPRVGSSFATGDAVNVAARLEQAAAPGEILVAERTASAIRGTFEFDEPRTVPVKGKPEGVVCRRLVRALSRARPHGGTVVASPFVGRGRELDLLHAAYGRVVRDEQPELVTIVGEAGVGKTRLAREVWDRLGSVAPTPRKLAGRCPAYGRGITYRAFAEVLRQHLGGVESELELLLAELEDGAILRLTFGLDAPVDLHPFVARSRLESAWLRLLERLSREQAVVLLLEDLHWGEDPLFELLGRVLDELHGPLLVLGTARPELLERDSWIGHQARSTRVSLEPLSGEEAERIVEGVLGAETPGPLRKLVTSWAEGNPFFLEELIGMLIDQGVLTRSDGVWSAHTLAAEFAIPDSVQSLLAARIDLLSQTEKSTLQAAAVIGRSFHRDPLQDLLEGAEPDVPGLVQRDFIRRPSGSGVDGDDEYGFKHALTREVAYSTLPKAERARLHARFATWLEARAGGTGDEDAPLLAHHYAEAVDPDHADLAWPGEQETLQDLRVTAVAWHRRAADLAIARYALDEALALLRRALELEPSRSEQVELWRAIGRASVLSFDGERFWTSMLRAADLSSDRETIADVFGDLAIETTTRSGMWKGRPSEDVVDGWIARALALAPRESAARAKALAAYSYLHPGAKDAAVEASEIAARLGDDELRSFAVDGLMATATALRDYHGAFEWAQHRLSIVRAFSDPDHRAEAHLSAVCASLGVGRIREARRLAGALEVLSAELTPHHRLHGVAFALLVEAVDGRWESVRELARRAEQAVVANEATPCVLNAWSLVICGVGHAHAADLEEARRLELSAEPVTLPTSDVTVAAKIDLALARGELDAVAELLPAEPPRNAPRPPWDVHVLSVRLDALSMLGDRERVEREAPSLVLPGTYFEPFALRALGVVREDAELLERALGRFEAMELLWHAERTRALLAPQR